MSLLPRFALALSLLACLASAAQADQVVLGLEGQPDLRLDFGRPLDELIGRPGQISPIEKARLDARGLLCASRLSKRAAVERIVGIVQQRLSRTDEESYSRVSRGELERGGEAHLSVYVKRHVGLCRERAFLLQRMLEEGGLGAEVKYGVLYDRRGRELGGHAWVETTIGGKRARLDPSMARPVSVGIRAVPVEETLPGGQARTILASRSRRHVYVPTDDLVIRH